ncbi:hypothetical protein [Cupriavidus necator]|uniref:hypothetical protein n=1 Tax=Cupriavidus necator TaxID=106590 RepID=UPI00339D678C
MSSTNLEELPPDLTAEIRETDRISRSYLQGLWFIVQDTARDPSYFSNHLLSFFSQDLLQSAVSIASLTTNGLLNVAKRELRFLIEVSVKIAVAQQGLYVSTIAEKLSAFDKDFRSPSIGIKRSINLYLLLALLHKSGFGWADVYAQRLERWLC